MTISRILFFTFIFSFFHGAVLGAEKSSDYVFGRDRMEEVFKGYISKRFNISEENIRLGSFRYHPMRFKSKPVEVRVEERRAARNGNRLLLRVRFVLNSKKEKNSFISLPFKILRDVVVSKETLKRGEVLTENNISVKKIWADYGIVSDLPRSYFIGKRVLKRLNSGSPLKERDVGSVPVVKRGDLVTVLFEKNGIKINTKGVARGDALPGDLVKVLSNFSKKIVVARVVRRDLVSVDY